VKSQHTKHSKYCTHCTNSEQHKKNTGANTT